MNVKPCLLVVLLFQPKLAGETKTEVTIDVQVEKTEGEAEQEKPAEEKPAEGKQHLIVSSTILSCKHMSHSKSIIMCRLLLCVLSL